MNRPTLIILCGICGSGKTTYAQKYVQKRHNTVHLSSDSIRIELLGNANDQSQNGLVFTIMEQRAVEALNNGNDVIYDCTNMTRKDRAGVINACPKFAKIECHIIWQDIETCIERDASRERTVGKEVIDRMLKRFQFPYYDEGIDEIKVILPENFDDERYLVDVVKSLRIPHDNLHHTLGIFEHCFESRKYAVQHSFGAEIAKAAQLHDCGKPYVKSFVNNKGETTEIAHYYGHQCTSSYIACGLIQNPDILWLISTHMSPFLNEKYYNNLPPYLKLMVDQLHECDLAAH